jgi:heme exporter protein A
LLRMLAGLSEPAKGTLIWRGLDSRIERSAFVQDLLYLGHASAIKDELLPVENVMASCVLQGEECSESQVRAVLNQLGLGDRLEVESLSLSAGQRRKIALARLWLTHRPIWLLDEPFNALDGLAVRQLSQRISDHVQAQGICLFTTHQLVEIKAERYLTLALDPFSASFNSRTQQNEVTR